MTENEIISKLKDILKLVVNKDADLENITLSSTIDKDLGVSSVGLIYIVVAIEELFDIDMSDVTFTTFKQVSDVVEYIKEKTWKNGK